VDVSRATRWGQRAAIATFVLGILLVVVPALSEVGSLFDDARVASHVQIVVTSAPGGVTTTETTTSPGTASIFERSLGVGGLLMIRLGIVAIGSFLAGAIIRHIAMGNFPFEVGPLKVAQDAAAVGEELALSVSVLADELDRVVTYVKAVAAEVDLMKETTRQGFLAVSDEFAGRDAPSPDWGDTGKLEEVLETLAKDHDQTVACVRALVGELDVVRAATRDGILAITREIERLGHEPVDGNGARQP